MKKFLIAGCAIAAMFAPAVATATTAANGSSANPVPIEYWAVRDAVSNVSVSPDGKYMSLLKIESKDGDPVIEVYETDDLSKKPVRLNAKPMEILSIDGWVSDDVFFGSAMQIVRNKMKGPEQDIREYKSFAYSMKDKKFTEISGSFSFEGALPKEPTKILIATSRGPAGSVSDDPFEAFRPRSYYKFDVYSGRKTLVMKGGGKQPQAGFDIDGYPRLSQGIDAAADEIITYYRNQGEDSWRELFREKDKDFEKNQFTFIGDKPGAPKGIGYALARNGEDTVALWEYDFNNSKFLTKVYGRPDVDITGVSRSSMFWAGNDKIVAARYQGAKLERHWLDQEEKALYDKIRPSIKNAFSMSVSSRSRDGNTMIVTNSGPKDSGTSYLLKDGKLMKLGSRNPLLKDSDYSEVEYIKYPARDGLMIPAYVTKPKGPGPHPLIVLPHGGPYVPEVIVYDEWSQMLANNGYMVIQPQYRGSLGHGYNHYIKTWHEHGLGMNDDKDDGAKYLISKGLVDPDRVAMFGWSYGGYAALVAASRENNIYQCTIPGAFVADPLMSYNGRKNTTFKYFDELSAQRGGKHGINPMDEVEKVNVPMLLIHPEHDRRVIYKHFTKYKKALEKAGKNNMKYLTLKKADHFLYTHRYDHNMKYYTAILDYLKNDCGPGGL
ncbi:MAG: S9 family peptidase [Acidimicrobiales bacterium]|nr:S9 family peptidase [Hyphomonadaceae bacterium]RZV44563.1 MAG: S9 family peptidase [Acidimicrobiales bacterium]